MDSQHKCDDAPEGIVPLSPALADELSAHLAPEHAREIREFSGLDPRAALRLSIAVSLLAFAATDSAGRAIFAFGVERPGAITNAAQVWMIGSPDIPAHARKTLRCARWGLAEAFRITGAARLEQYIPAWYGTGLRFAERLGFRLEHDGSGTVHVILERRERRTHGHPLVQ